jgi:hypothetical protein
VWTDEEIEIEGGLVGKSGPGVDLGLEFTGKLDTDDADIEMEILSKSKAKQLVFGWFKLATKQDKPVADRQGDEVSDEDLEEAAYSYVMDSREGGEMHRRTGVAKLVESIAFTREKQDALGINLKDKRGNSITGWFGGFKVTDPEVWKKVENEQYSMFSIHGKGQRRKIGERE